MEESLALEQGCQSLLAGCDLPCRALELFLDNFYLFQPLLDAGSIPQVFADGYLTDGADFQFDGNFIILLLIHVAVQGLYLKDMATVFQLYKAGIRLILKAKKYLGDLFQVADTALLGTWLPTQTNARVAASQQLGTRHIAWGPVAGLRAEFGALIVLAAPDTGLHAGAAQLPTLLLALAVDTAVLTCSLAGWALTNTGLLAPV